MLIPLDHGTFESHYSAYLRVSRSVREATIKNYLSDARMFWAFVQSEEPTALKFALTQKTLAKYVAWLTSKGLASNSIARNLSSLRSLVRYLSTQDSETESFPPLLGSPRVHAAPPSFLNETQIRGLLDGPDLSTLWGLRDACILEILYSTGVRVSELTQIDRDAVNLDGGTIKVLGKGAKERMVFLTQKSQNLLVRYLLGIKELGTFPLTGTQPLFVNRKNGRLSNRSIQRIIKGYAKNAGIDPSTHPHTLRHSFATHMLDGGASLSSVQKLLGHSTTRATQVYIHPSLEKARDVYHNAHPRATKRPTKNRRESTL